MPRFRRLDTSLSPQKPRFFLWLVYVRFVEDVVAMGKGFSPSTSTLLVSVTPHMLTTHMLLIATIISWTSGGPGTFSQRSALSGIGKHWKQTCFRFICGVQMFVYKRKNTLGNILKMFSAFWLILRKKSCCHFLN